MKKNKKGELFLEVDEKIVAYLNHPDNPKRRKVKVTIACGTSGIVIQPEKYEDHCGGEPILLENYDHVRLVVWSDINQEDPTHDIDLSKAHISNRPKNPKSIKNVLTV
jgi:hypothetical protein